MDWASSLGAFLLSWAAEVAELDVSASLAIAVLALIAVLPEYAIEAVLAWDAGSSFDTVTGGVTTETSRVAANVTGSNRLLIGLGLVGGHPHLLAEAQEVRWTCAAKWAWR